ncbi:MAG: glycosyltransferase family 39 protein [Bacteroidales bacterium]|nr:glycosyltransferase family 39 protein [Bacteroidales bacterium]
MKKESLLINIIIAVLGALLFIPGTGGVRLFDWDEINFAESAREMLLTGNWFDVQINFESFWEKPPLFIWAQALSMQIFGVNEFAARFPNAVIGIITLLVLFNIGRKTQDTRFGILWVLMYGISFLPFFYFKSGIIDPWFNLFIFLGIYFFSRYTDPHAEGQRMGHAALSALFTGLAIITKGPVAFLIFGLTFIVWLIAARFRFSFRWKDVAVYIIVLALAGGSWFIALALSGHADVIQDFIDYQIRLFETKDAGHGGFLLYHFVILFLGVTPASVFALSTFKRSPMVRETGQRLAGLFRWMMASFWVVLILFTIVRTKIVHYSSFCYFPLSFFGAYAAYYMRDGRIRFNGLQRGFLIGISTLYGLLLTGLTLFDSFKEKLIPYVQDPFAVSCMEASSEWKGFEPFIGIVLIAATIWFCISFKRGRHLRSFIVLALGNILFAMTAILCAVPEVEKYSQASAVEFYIERQGEDCYVKPAYFKSYAQYFYTLRQPANKCEDFEWLRSASLDKPCYFVVKDIPEDIERLHSDVPDAEFLYRRSGFQFFVRPKANDENAKEHGEGQQCGVE